MNTQHVIDAVNAAARIDPSLAAFPYQTGRETGCAACGHPLAHSGIHYGECSVLIDSLTQ